MSKKLLLSLLLTGCAALTAGTVRCAGLILNTTPSGKFQLTNPAKNGDWNHATLEPILRLGPDGRSVSLPPPTIRQEGQKLTVEYSTPERKWQIVFAPRGRMLVATSRFTNASTRELWLEPELKLTLDGNRPLTRFWDGFGSVRTVGDAPLNRKGIKGETEKHVGASTMPFPVSAAGGDQEALFTGSVPFDPVSYTAGALIPEQKQLTYSLRLVAAPQETLEFRQTLGSANTAYGMPESIVQQYYEAFPECWAVVIGQDNPYTWGYHGLYENWWSMPDAENSRRLGITLEWTYCPYRRAGDMLMRDEFWDYQAKNAFRSDKVEFGQRKDMGKIGKDEYRKWRRDNFRKMARPFGLMFYNTVAGTWCEQQLAQQYYPDAINDDKSVANVLNRWSTAHDQEVRVFPMGTSFAKAFEDDMVQLVSELDLPGFALDCAYGGAYYRGPAVEKTLPGRAWDDQGKFIDQSVAINRQVDFIHNINQEPDRKLTAFINGYLKGDYVMVESPFLNLGKFKRWMPLLRWYIGPRPGCVHGHGFLFRDIVPDWRDKKQDDFLELMPKLSDFVIMNEFKFGLTESHLTQRGNPQQLYNRPELLELLRTGWQAEIPMQINGLRIPYRARYGRGVNSVFFLGNSGEQTVAGPIGFDNARLNDDGWTMLFNRKMRDTARTENRIEQNFTRVDASLPSRTPVLYEAVAAIRTPAGDQKWKVGSDKKLNRQTYHLEFRDGKPFTSPLLLRDIRNFRPESVRINGKALSMTNGRTEPVAFKSGDKVEIRYASTEFQVPAAAILNFPFTDAQKQVAFLVQIAKNGDALALAERFNDYFNFCRKHGVIAKNSPLVTISIVTAFSPQAGTVTLLTGKDQLLGTEAVPSGISIAPRGGLIVKADSPGEAQKLLNALFGVMDRRYEYIFPFRGVMGLYPEIINHFGMYGKSLPYRKYFEEATR